MPKSKHEYAVELLSQLEDEMVKVEKDGEFDKKQWIAISKVLYFLLREYVIKN